MPDLLAVAELASVTGLAEDKTVNTFAMSVATGAEAVEANRDAWMNAVADFYRDLVPPNTSPLGHYLGKQVSRTASAHRIKLYNITGHLDGSPHGSPIDELAFTITAPGGGIPGSLPAECAIVITLRGVGWQGQPVETPDTGDAGTERDRPKQRHTGRLYFGPLSNQIVGENPTTLDIIVPTGARTTIIDQCRNLHNELDAAGATWSIWSRKDTFLRNVTHVEVDDALDTQRRRGRAPSVRSSSEDFDV